MIRRIWGRMSPYWDETVRRYRAVRVATGGPAIPWVTLLVAAVMVVVAATTRPFFGSISDATFAAWSWSADRLLAGDWGSVVRATFQTRDVFMLSSLVASMFVSAGLYERAAGHRRAAAVLLGGAAWGYVGLTAALWVLSGTHDGFILRTMQTPDIGISAGIGASWAMLAALTRYRPAYLALGVLVVGGLVIHHQIADWEHAVAAATSFLIGMKYGPAYRTDSEAIRSA